MSAKPAILVAEDERTVRALLEDVLDELGYEPISAPDAAGALERFRARPDVRLAILDLSLPDRTGFAVLADLRAARPRFAAIVASGYEIDGAGAPWKKELEAAQAAGPLEVLAKPYKIEALAKAIERLLLLG